MKTTWDLQVRARWWSSWRLSRLYSSRAGERQSALELSRAMAGRKSGARITRDAIENIEAREIERERRREAMAAEKQKAPEKAPVRTPASAHPRQRTAEELAEADQLIDEDEDDFIERDEDEEDELAEYDESGQSVRGDKPVVVCRVDSSDAAGDFPVASVGGCDGSQVVHGQVHCTLLLRYDQT